MIDEEPEEDCGGLAGQEVFLSVGFGFVDKTHENSHGTVILKARVYRGLVEKDSLDGELGILNDSTFLGDVA